MANLTYSPISSIATAKHNFDAEGYCISPPIVSQDLIERVIPAMDAVIAGEYETGYAPCPWGDAGSDPNKICKIDQAHVSNRTICEFISNPEIGKWAAAVTGAGMVQVWAVQLLYKPPSNDAGVNVGWHQDYQYWGLWWQPDSELFTAWVAVSDVTEDAGPMSFVPKSHQWGFLNSGNFFSGDHEAQRRDMPVPEGEVWREIPAIMPPGAVSFHHKYTYHGSGANHSNGPRRSFAIHLRTEKSKVADGADEQEERKPFAPPWRNFGSKRAPGSPYVSNLLDPDICPVIYGNK